MIYSQFKERCPIERDCINLFIKLYYINNLSCVVCKETSKIYSRKESSRIFHCNKCNNSFSVFNNTIFERSQIDFRKWLYVFYLLTYRSNYIKAQQLANAISVNIMTVYRILRTLRKIILDKDTKLIGTLIEINDKIINGYLLNPVISE